MIRYFCFSLLFPILFCGQMQLIPSIFQDANVEFYQDGEQFYLSDEDFSSFEEKLYSSLAGARVEVGLSVADSDSVSTNMNSGLWIKLSFTEEKEQMGLNYDSLLVQVEKSSKGFNIIRGNDGIYEGRCFYLVLQNDFDDVYDFLSEKFSQDDAETQESDVVWNEKQAV